MDWLPKKLHSDDLAAIPTSATYHWGDLTAISTPPQLIKPKDPLKHPGNGQQQQYTLII